MTVPSFIESPRLELPRGWIYDVEPLYQVTVIQRGRGGEKRNLSTARPRSRISVTVPRDRIADIPGIRRFWHVARGRTSGFRVQDPTDYLSTADGFVREGGSGITSLDQPLIDDGAGGYELWKQYILGEGSNALIHERRIFKPVAGTVVVANEFQDEQDPSTWDLDETTGTVETLTGFTGTPTSWGGEFDLPVRFDSELPLRVEDFFVDSVSFVLLELIDVDAAG